LVDSSNLSRPTSKTKTCGNAGLFLCAKQAGQDPCAVMGARNGDAMKAIPTQQ
jgi:hypothetical protein